MLLGPAITTVIAACGIVTTGCKLVNMPHRIAITTVIAACGIVTFAYYCYTVNII